MSANNHTYRVRMTWTGNTGKGTVRPAAYSRNHEIVVEGKPVIPASSDPAFRGDPTRYNPEELLVAALSDCHMLWYLDMCARQGIVVTAYVDDAEGFMTENEDGSGQFTQVILHPQITLVDTSQQELADAQHHLAHELCFIARSVNFPVTVEPVYCSSLS